MGASSDVRVSDEREHGNELDSSTKYVLRLEGRGQCQGVATTHQLRQLGAATCPFSNNPDTHACRPQGSVASKSQQEVNVSALSSNACVQVCTAIYPSPTVEPVGDGCFGILGYCCRNASAPLALLRSCVRPRTEWVAGIENEGRRGSCHTHMLPKPRCSFEESFPTPFDEGRADRSALQGARAVQGAWGVLCS